MNATAAKMFTFQHLQRSLSVSSSRPVVTLSQPLERSSPAVRTNASVFIFTSLVAILNPGFVPSQRQKKHNQRFVSFSNYKHIFYAISIKRYFHYFVPRLRVCQFCR